MEQEITYVTVGEDGTTNTETQAIQEDTTKPEPVAEAAEEAATITEETN